MPKLFTISFQLIMKREINKKNVFVSSKFYIKLKKKEKKKKLFGAQFGGWLF